MGQIGGFVGARAAGSRERPRNQRVPKSPAADRILFNIGLGLGYTRNVVYLPRGGLAAAGAKTEGDKHGF